MSPTCVHCNGWGCTWCHSVIPPRLGEQSDPELAEMAALVAAEREACARLVSDLADEADSSCCACTLDKAAAAIRARGGT